MDYGFEISARENGYVSVCGIDEAGRGPLAGPVYAAAVILPEGLVIDGLDDSKKLSEKKREILFDIISARFFRRHGKRTRDRRNNHASGHIPCYEKGG